MESLNRLTVQELRDKCVKNFDDGDLVHLIEPLINKVITKQITIVKTGDYASELTME